MQLMVKLLPIGTLKQMITKTLRAQSMHQFWERVAEAVTGSRINGWTLFTVVGFFLKKRCK